jgi:hypothetical protein
MALISVSRTYTFTSNGNFQTTASFTGLSFDTDSHTIVPSSGSFPLTFLDPRPGNFVSPPGTYLWFECGAAPDYIQTKWFYQGGTDVSTTTTVNSTECGWLPPVAAPLSCDLLLRAVVTGDIITASVSGARGTVKYSIDGGITKQTSGEFKDLAPRSYVVSAYDDGAPNCSRSTTVFVVATPPTLNPVPGALPDVAFVGNPIALRAVATRPRRALLLELFVESAHGSRQYRRLLQRLRPTGLDGATIVELQKELGIALTPDRPDLSRVPGLRRLTSGIRRYYAAVAEILPATGKPGPFVFQAPSTCLLGGLSWAAARAAPFFDPLPARWLTWRPDLIQVVGEDHVLLHTALVPASINTCIAEVRCYAKGEVQPAQVLLFQLVLNSNQILVSAGNQGVDDAQPMTLNPPTPKLVELQVPVSSLQDTTHRVSVRLIGPDDEILTEHRLFRIDRTKRRRQFFFFNSLGTFDTLSCYGPRSGKTTAERTVATTLAAPNYDPQGGTDAVVELLADERIAVSSGAVAPEELHWLRELQTSKHVYELAQGRLLKIKLLTKEFINYQDDAGADGFGFEYQYCFDSTPYSPLYDWI